MDEKTLLHLYRTCYPGVARYIINRNGTADEAEEAFHAALSALLHQLEKGATINDYGAYLFRSAWNAFLAERRHTSKHEASDAFGAHLEHSEDAESFGDDAQAYGPDSNARVANLPEPGPGPDHHADRELLLEAAEACMGELSRAQQAILQLSFDLEENLDDEAIAARLGVTRDYVRVARFRAMEALRARMYKRGFGYMM